jgi:hypothetical protein
MRRTGPGIVVVLAISIAAPARAQLPAAPPLPQPALPAPQLPAAPSLPAAPLPTPAPAPAPALPVPALPAPQLPVAPRSAPASPAPSSPAPAAAPTAAAPSRTAPAPSSSSSGRPASAAATGGGGTPARAPSTRASEGRAEGSEPVRVRGERRAERRADRRVERLVARYGMCLSALTVRQRRVLRLRAGVGPREPETRAAVARRLELPLARVRKAERRGLRTLRRIGRDGCGAAAHDGAGAGPGVPTAGDPAAATVLASGVPGAAGAGPTTSGDPARGGDAAGGGTGSGSGGHDGGGTGSTAAGAVKGISATGPAPPGGPTDVTLPLLLLVLAGGAAFGYQRLRRSRAG